MVYRKYARKRATRPLRVMRRRKPATRAGLKSLIKSVALNNTETKQSSHYSENVQLNHNRTYYGIGLLSTTQGTENPSGASQNDLNRLGDEIIARGLKLKFWVSFKVDRPNQIVKLSAFQYNTDTTTMTDAIYWKGADGQGSMMNRLIDTVDPYRVKLLKSRVLKPRANFSIPDNGHEASFLCEMWVPLHDRKVKYRVDNSTRSLLKDLGFSIVTYDAYGTLISDNIASFAYHSCLYFKDP